MKKEVAIRILEDIQSCLNQDDWKCKTLSTISQYKKGLLIDTNPKIKKLVKKYKEYITKYGENGKKTIAVGKNIDEEIKKIYNN